MKSILSVGSQFIFTMKVMPVYSTESTLHGNGEKDISSNAINSQGAQGIISHHLETLLGDDFEPIKSFRQNRVIQFQGVNFDPSVSRTTPVEVLRGNQLPQFQNLASFLRLLEQYDLLDNKDCQGKVIYADDQFVV